MAGKGCVMQRGCPGWRQVPGRGYSRYLEDAERCTPECLPLHFMSISMAGLNKLMLSLGLVKSGRITTSIDNRNQWRKRRSTGKKNPAL